MDSQLRPASRAAMSIDVEDWFQVENLKGAIARRTWRERELRVERNVDRMLELMADADARSTCFVLGWIAERCPRVVERIAAAGHEIASHGYGHELLGGLTPEVFRDDVVRSKTLLEGLTATEVVGYRAPAFSITDWAIPVLQELGFAYDSSVFPAVAHDRYGRLSGLDVREPVSEVVPGFHEVCVSCLRIGSRGVPWGGGGYFRLMPYPVFRLGVKRVLAGSQPYVFYIHPWEIDPGQPRVKGLPRGYAFRHYVGLAGCERRFARLLREFSWSPIGELVRQAGARDRAPAATGVGADRREHPA
ncbi:MAG TPA: XrtA system polysaccharide deacetylase [Candidatus Limnocylindrales bacterium]|nr:XrtA system polysaccharide deacetylase [Candidatus Limnocylindrales bacterium]